MLWIHKTLKKNLIFFCTESIASDWFFVILEILHPSGSIKTEPSQTFSVKCCTNRNRIHLPMYKFQELKQIHSLVVFTHGVYAREKKSLRGYRRRWARLSASVELSESARAWDPTVLNDHQHKKSPRNVNPDLILFCTWKENLCMLFASWPTRKGIYMPIHWQPAPQRHALLCTELMQTTPQKYLHRRSHWEAVQSHHIQSCLVQSC